MQQQGNPLRIIMDSLGKGDMIENDDMELEEDDIPPPPPAKRSTRGKKSTTPSHPPPPNHSSAKKEEKTLDLAYKQKVQHDIANIVKMALKIPFKKRKISKDDYKSIMKQVVQKVYESRQVKRGDPLRPDKITEMVAVYIKQTQKRKGKGEGTENASEVVES